MPGELVVLGRVLSIAVAKLIDSWAREPAISTGLWEALFVQSQLDTVID